MQRSVSPRPSGEQECLSSARPSDTKRVGEDGEDAVGNDDEDDAGDPRRGGGKSDGGGTAPTLDAAHAAGNGDQHAKDRALDDADGKVDEMDAVGQFMDIFDQRELEHDDTNKGAADIAHEIGIDA